jgi:hypothetical protein
MTDTFIILEKVSKMYYYKTVIILNVVTDFAYGFGAGISFFLLVEIVRCLRMACQSTPAHTPHPSIQSIPQPLSSIYIPASAPIMSPRLSYTEPPPLYKN